MRNITILLLALLVISCSDEDEKDREDYSQWTITFNETMSIYGTSPVSKTEKFIYNHGRLIQHITKQQYYEEEISYEVNLTYSDNSAIVATDGVTLVYTLNTEGYASQCVYTSPSQKRIYLFSYSTERYLTGIVESIDGEEYSSTSLTYENGDITSINSTLNGYENKHIYQPGEDSSKYHLPCLGLLELHPFTFHIEALYAGLLGKDPRHFTVRSSPEDVRYKEYTNYTYTFDKNGNLTQMGCQTYSNGQAATDYPNKRSIAVLIESDNK